MNDIWALPSGEWIIYSDENGVIRDFMTLADLEVVTSYHGIMSRHRAVQFKFRGGEDLLRYVCVMSGLDYVSVGKLAKTPGVRYNDVFGDSIHQTPLFVATSPRRKKKRQRPGG